MKRLRDILGLVPRTPRIDPTQVRVRELGKELDGLQEQLSAAKRELKEPTRTVEALINVPVIVSAAMISRLWEILEKEPGNPAIVCATVDGRITTWRSLEAALKQANALDREIRVFVIKNERSAEYGRVELYARHGGATEVRVFGEEKKAERLFEALETTILTGIRGTPGYGWFAKHGYRALWAATIIVGAYAFLRGYDALLEPVPGLVAMSVRNPFVAAVIVPVGAGALMWALGHIDRWVRNAIRRYWPMVVVEIGNGEQRDQAAGRVRKTFVAFAVAAVVGALLGLVADLIDAV